MENNMTEQEREQELLDRLVAHFNQAADASDAARTHAERDRDYYDGRQWTAEEEQQLKKRGQAPIVVNRIKPKMDYLLGMERQMRTDPRCYPRNPSDEGAARAATDAVRFVLDNNDFDQTRSTVFEHLLIEGAGFAEVVAEPRGTKTRITINPISWDRAFFDPHSRRRDMKDARFRGQVIWMDLPEARAKYPNKTELLDTAYATGDGGGGSTYDDQPAARWADHKRQRVRVVEIWYREGGGINQAVFCRGGILKGPLPSPYTDDEGQPEDPYVFCSAFITRHGNRYGAVRQLIGVQDEINKRRSKALHLLSVRQVRAEKGAVEDVARARRELAKPDGWIETVPGFSMDILPTGDMAQAQFSLLTEAKEEIDAVGASSALTGKLGEGESGRAIQARQQGGQMELGPLFDTLRAWQMRIYRKCWGRVRQFWTEERWVRVTDDERNLSWVGLNRPVTMGEELAAELGSIPPEMLGDPRLDEVVQIENRVAELDVDVIVGDMPDTVTIRHEEFRTLAELAQAGLPIPPEALIEASGIRSKDKILAALKGNPEAEAVEVRHAEQLRELEIEKLIHEIHERHAGALKTEAEAAKISRDT